MTRTWVRKVTAWMLALICYKPAAAAVYATAFTMIGSGGSPQTMLMGFVMLLLSVLTLPALMRFFTWTTGTIARSGGGGQLLGAATVGAIAIGAMRSSPAAGRRKDQAAYLNSRLGPPPAAELVRRRLAGRAEQSAGPDRRIPVAQAGPVPPAVARRAPRQAPQRRGEPPPAWPPAEGRATGPAPPAGPRPGWIRLGRRRRASTAGGHHDRRSGSRGC